MKQAEIPPGAMKALKAFYATGKHGFQASKQVLSLTNPRSLEILTEGGLLSQKEDRALYKITPAGRKAVQNA